jgi:hypothetical protein
MTIATMADPVVTLDDLRRRWPQGFEPEPADGDYRHVARMTTCRRCGGFGVEAKAHAKRDEWGKLLRVAFVCPRCGHSEEV